MKIIDCFLYHNENLILDLRLNLLNKYVDKFIIVEAKQSHTGEQKKNYNFNINNFSEFKTKIEYLKLDDFPKGLSDWGRENFHRNAILEALHNVNNDDYIIISDVDEIPNLEKLDKILAEKRKYTAFKQKMIYYKLNLLNDTDSDWFGSKMCKFKYLKNPQWLRNQRVKNYPFYRFNKIKWNIVEEGGWHFSYIMSPEAISDKIKSFAHSELNKPEFTNIEEIKKRIESKKDLFNRDHKFKVLLDKDLPNYILENKDLYLKFLL